MNKAAETPWLSVIMPSHCGERWIDGSLRSIEAEADRGIEVLMLDSTPGPATLDVAGKFADRLNLRLLKRADLAGWPAKTNIGVSIAAADHVCWLHQDDLWLPGRAAAVRSWIGSAPQAPLHLAPSAIIDREGRRLGLWHCPLPANRELSSALVVERLLVQNFISVPAPVFRKDAWLATGGLDEALWYTADWDIWLKLARFGPVYYHDRATTAFRIHGGSLSMTGSRDAADFRMQMQTVLERHQGRRAHDIGYASIAVNVALAQAAAGDFSGLAQAAGKVLRLGPGGIRQYLRDSRIVERLTPRVRAKLRGAF